MIGASRPALRRRRHADQRHARDAASAEAIDRIDRGEQPDALDVYRAIVPSVLRLAWATLPITIAAGLMVITVVGIPFAVIYLIRKSVTIQSIVIEKAGGLGT